MEIQRIYFLGIGGIGMSALARYFLHEGRRVAGYDRVCSALTEALETEGAEIHYTEDPDAIPEEFRHPDGTIVVYTPAVPDDHREFVWFRAHGFTIEKRSQMLGHLSQNKYVMAVAGTHGKTTTSTLVAWLNREVEGCGSAFLGGISKNFNSNLVLGEGDRLAVEADEFDRSFLRLSPDVAVVTAVDADHLDIYGTYEAVKEAFARFIERIHPGGALILKDGVDVAIRNRAITVYRYACDTPCDFYARNIRLIDGGHYRYDLATPSGMIAGCTLGIPGRVNVENAVAAVVMDDSLKLDVPTFMSNDKELLQKISALKGLNGGMRDESKKLMRSSTSEILFDAKNLSYKVITPKSEVFAAQAAAKLGGKFAQVEMGGEKSVVMLTSLDNLPLEKSKRILVLYLTRITNTNMRRQGKTLVIDGGQLPLLMRVDSCKLALNADLSSYKLYALDTDGTRMCEVPLEVKGGRTLAELNNYPQGRGTFAFELVKE